ncbi:MAG: hypothetical protein QXY90_05975 [Candidatus Anstonellales archaeon]
MRAETNSDVDRQEKDRLAGFIEKIGEEEKRYAKAYGTGTLEFEQFKDLMREAKKKKLIYQKQLDELNQKITQEGIDPFQLDEIIEEAKRAIAKLDFENKFMVIRDIIDKIIVKGGRTVEVYGHLPLFAVNMGYEPIGRSRCFTVPTLEFKFNFTLPEPRKMRIIAKRDEHGRIIRSIPPQMQFEMTTKPFYSLLQG